MLVSYYSDNSHDIVLPFLRKQEYFLMPILFIGIGLGCASLAGMNSTRVIMALM